MMRIHAGHGMHVELDEACLAAFDLAVADIGLAGEVARRVSAYFRGATVAQGEWADNAAAVPEGLAFNRA